MEFLLDLDSSIEPPEEAFQPQSSQQVQWLSSQTSDALEALFVDVPKDASSKRLVGNGSGRRSISSNSIFSTDSSGSGSASFALDPFDEPFASASTNTYRRPRSSLAGSLASSSRRNNTSTSRESTPGILHDQMLGSALQKLHSVATKIKKEGVSSAGASSSRPPATRNRTATAPPPTGHFDELSASKGKSVNAKGKQKAVEQGVRTISRKPSLMDIDTEETPIVASTSVTQDMPPPALPPEHWSATSSYTTTTITTTGTKNPAQTITRPTTRPAYGTTANVAATSSSSRAAQYQPAPSPSSTSVSSRTRSATAASVATRSAPPVPVPAPAPVRTSTTSYGSSTAATTRPSTTSISRSAITTTSPTVPTTKTTTTTHAPPAPPRVSPQLRTSSRPPPLGMRRAHTYAPSASSAGLAPSSQSRYAPSSSQQLPTKQKGFKPPLINPNRATTPSTASQQRSFGVSGQQYVNVNIHSRSVSAQQQQNLNHGIGNEGVGTTTATIRRSASTASTESNSSSAAHSTYFAMSAPSSQSSNEEEGLPLPNANAHTNANPDVLKDLLSLGAGDGNDTDLYEDTWPDEVMVPESNTNNTNSGAGNNQGGGGGEADDFSMLENDPNDESYGDLLGIDDDALDEAMSMYD